MQVVVEDVSAAGLDPSPVADALAGSRADEARYSVEYVLRILEEEH